MGSKNIGLSPLTRETRVRREASPLGQIPFTAPEKMMLGEIIKNDEAK